MRYSFPLSLSIAIFYASLLLSCSDSSSDSTKDDSFSDIAIRYCRNSAHCLPDEVCVKGICQKKDTVDVGEENYPDSSYDLLDTAGEISNLDIEISDIEISDYGDVGVDIISEYTLGISSVYEGSAGESINEEYNLRSVSGYSGMGIIGNDEYEINSVRFR